MYNPIEMKILVDRQWKKNTYTIGKLYIDNTFFCNTLEDTDRELTQSMPLGEIQKLKKPSVTAVPIGTYTIDMNTVSPRFSKNAWMVKNCRGAKLPRLLNVPGFSGVLIHTGNTAKNTDGCILVGKNDVKGMVTKSREYFLTLYNKLYVAYKKGEKITITIK